MNQDDAHGGPRKIEPLLGTIGLILLLCGCFFVLKPFLSALMWAIVLAYSLWPLQQRFTRWFRGGRTFAAILVTLTLTLVTVGPFVLLGFSIADDAKSLGTATRKWYESFPDDPPEWMVKAPVVGDEMSNYWRDFAADKRRLFNKFQEEASKEAPPRAIPVEQRGDELIIRPVPPLPTAAPAPAAGLEEPNAAGPPTGEDGEKKPEKSKVAERLAGQLGQLSVWLQGGLIAAGTAIGKGVLVVLLSVFLAFFLLRDGAALSERLATGMHRIAGKRGQHLLSVAGGTVRGVVYGILGTALAQAVVAGVGFAIAGVPGAILLGVMTFFFSAVPVGPPLLWIPATVWLFVQGRPGWGIFMALWGTLGISGVDNIVKPYLISHESKTPFVLVFCGVIGGAFAFGLVGVFLGPTLLAVTFRLIEEWSATRPVAVPDDVGKAV